MSWYGKLLYSKAGYKIVVVAWKIIILELPASSDSALVVSFACGSPSPGNCLNPSSPDLAQPPQPESAQEARQHHPGEDHPECCAIAFHQRLRALLIAVPGLFSHGGRDDSGRCKADGSAKLAERVEDGAGKRLSPLWEDIRDDDDADGEKDVAGYWGEYLLASVCRAGKYRHESRTWVCFSPVQEKRSTSMATLGLSRPSGVERWRTRCLRQGRVTWQGHGG